jgi:hypothetical protein
MNLATMQLAPFAEGFIRVAQAGDDVGNKKFIGAMEVLSRHHEVSKVDAGSSLADAGSIQPRLAKHPIEATLEKLEPNKVAGKIVEIPITLFFNKPSNALKASYVAYDSGGIPVCRGNGETAKRRETDGHGTIIQTTPACTGDDTCPLVASGKARCKRQVSMTVQIKCQSNSLSVFEVRTSSYNSLRALRGQLELIATRFSGLRHVPLKLKLWQASNLASSYEPFDLFNLDLDANDELEAMRVCKKARDEEMTAGLTADVDTDFEKFAGDPLDPLLTEEYAIVSDLYENINAKTRSGRRRGTSSAAHAILMGEPTEGLAFSMIGAAVQESQVSRKSNGVENE